MANTRPLIALEEHFISEAARAWGIDNDSLGFIKRFPPPIASKLSDLNDIRLQDMEAGAVSLQVVSHGPTNGSAPIDICRQANDELHKAVQTSEGRLAGFAMIPMNEPAAAAEELERCVETLGFVGTLVNNHEKGRFYDDAFFWPVLAQCQVLDVPIYLHPTVPGSSVAKGSGNYPDIVAQGLDTYCWGWHSETGLHILRLFASGLFDEYPRLKIIIGHMGEMLPFMLDRIIRFARKQWPERQRDLQTVWDENIHITTAGMFSVAPMACLLRVCKIEHILYSVDYPFASNEEGKEFMHELSLSGLCSEEEMDMVAFGNAEALLGVRALR
ncbi:MAG: hypothetical protein ALECFALPRED_008938 [Alectoria fallacina]|uniref:Amidohydrolase-related domain-containing protein n=1 Tax=Alectoria fallacina TaxID=1903189 RepID=A0A8H3IAM7_9LECA|nr:MAG: hypothetical protein ALECFALPRED_008938 [Alectoria fallacina]